MALAVWLKEGHTVEAVRRFADEFSSATGIEVDLRSAPEGQAHDALISGAATPDVITVPFWYLSELLSNDILVPVSSVLEMAGMGCAAFPRASIDALTRGGVLWAVPHTLTGGLLSYRKDVLDDLGIAPPRTTDAVLVAARTIAAARPAMAGLVARASAEFSSLETYAGWAWSAGIKLLPDDGDPSPEVCDVGVGELVSTLRDCAPPDLVERSYARVGELLSDGAAAQMFDTSAWPYFLEDASCSKVAGRMAYATITGASAPAQFLYAEGLGITRWCRQPQEAAEFIAWRQSASVVQREVCLLGRMDLPRLDLLEADWFQAELARRAAGGYMAAVWQSWEQADSTHVAFRADFVTRARLLMRAIGAAVSGQYPSVSGALRASAEPADRGR
jgi:ABC-type glycerol-3-phosphate transport system substrate-binding protein